MAGSNASQTIEELKDRYDEFQKQKIVVENDRKHALEKLDELKAEALEKFGSCEPEDLEKKLKKMKSDNEKKRAKYQKDLDSIQGKLDEINEQFDDEELEE